MGTMGPGISDNDTAHDLYGALRAAPDAAARQKLIGEAVADLAALPPAPYVRHDPDRLLQAIQWGVAAAALLCDKAARERVYTRDLEPDTAPLDLVPGPPDGEEWLLLHTAYAAVRNAYALEDHPDAYAFKDPADERRRCRLLLALGADLNQHRRQSLDSATQGRQAPSRPRTTTTEEDPT